MTPKQHEPRGYKKEKGGKVALGFLLIIIIFFVYRGVRDGRREHLREYVNNMKTTGKYTVNTFSGPFDRAPLMDATYFDDIAFIKTLISKGSNVNLKEKHGGFTPLMVAATRCRASTVEFLIKHGANVNVRNNFGWTALMMASDDGRKEIMELFISSGADMNVRSKKRGETALIRAAFNALIFCEDGDKFTVKRRDALELLLKRGADVNIVNSYGEPALLYAVKRGNVNISELLIKNGADVSIKDNGGVTAMIMAKQSKNKKLISLINATLKP